MRSQAQILDLVGRTPIIRLDELFGDSRNEIFVKMECQNPSGSIKDRVALAMVRDARERGVLGPDSIIVEPTTGNTGISLSFVAGVLGYRARIVMPESMSRERRQMIRAFGAQIHLTPEAEDVQGAVDRAREMVRSDPRCVLLDQFSNPANPRIHEEETAREIEEAMGIPDILVCGVGTGGTLTGVGRYMKRQNPGFRIYAVEPRSSLPGTSLHRIQGIGDGFEPENLDRSLIDGFLPVYESEAFGGIRRLFRREGIFAGVSTGAMVSGVGRLNRIHTGKRILFFAADRGERYLSMDIWGTE